jgi:hypothetical protein
MPKHVCRMIVAVPVVTTGLWCIATYWKATRCEGCSGPRAVLRSVHFIVSLSRGGVSSTGGLGPTMTTWGQSICISIGMLPQTLIMPRLDKLSRLGARI